MGLLPTLGRLSKSLCDYSICSAKEIALSISGRYRADDADSTVQRRVAQLPSQICCYIGLQPCANHLILVFSLGTWK